MTDRPEPPHPLPLPSGEREESGRLAENIVYFARALRAAGIPVGPGAVLDALEAVKAAGVGTRDDFYWTLHAVFVKRHEHSILFDQAFRIFFRRRGYVDQLLAMMLPQAPAQAREHEGRRRFHRSAFHRAAHQTAAARGVARYIRLDEPVQPHLFALPPRF